MSEHRLSLGPPLAGTNISNISAKERGALMSPPTLDDRY